jgi:hypothetical protein
MIDSVVRVALEEREQLRRSVAMARAAKSCGHGIAVLVESVIRWRPAPEVPGRL